MAEADVARLMILFVQERGCNTRSALRSACTAARKLLCERKREEVLQGSKECSKRYMWAGGSGGRVNRVAVVGTKIRRNEETGTRQDWRRRVRRRGINAF